MCGLATRARSHPDSSNRHRRQELACFFKQKQNSSTGKRQLAALRRAAGFKSRE